MPAIHSDILVHWTGKDIGPFERDDNGKIKENTYNESKEKEYCQRLLNILRYGLWMTYRKPKGPAVKPTVDVPPTPYVCFTELKLSESEAHAKEYGYLGIGFKRPFVLYRGGRPMIYWGFNTDKHRDRDILLPKCMADLSDKRLLHFFKPMNSGSTLNYDYYSESEWRIVFHDKLKEKPEWFDKPLVTPRKSLKNDPGFEEYMHGLPEGEPKKELKYLVPVDGWLAMIIYPSLHVKNRAQRCPEIRKAISQIKEIGVPKGLRRDHANWVEDGNLPVELDFDIGMHF